MRHILFFAYTCSIQIMNVCECNGTNIFMRRKMKCSTERGAGELNGTFHLSPNENFCSTARMRKHSLFVLCNLYKDLNSQRIFFLNGKMTLAQTKHFISRASNSTRGVLRGRLRHAKRTHCTRCICPA